MTSTGAWKHRGMRARERAFSMIEMLIVIGIIAILASLLLPTLRAHFEAARIDEMKSQLGIIEAALELYKSAFGDSPPSSAAGNTINAGNELLLAGLLTKQGGGPFVQPDRIARWLDDGDGDGRREIVDPWRTPWVYFHPSDYTGGEVYYKCRGKQVIVRPATKKENENVYENLTSYQLWAWGPNRADESGGGDDAGNIGK